LALIGTQKVARSFKKVDDPCSSVYGYQLQT